MEIMTGLEFVSTTTIKHLRINVLFVKGEELLIRIFTHDRLQAVMQVMFLVGPVFAGSF